MLTDGEKTKALNWLYDAGNPVIKLWAAERLGVSGEELARLRADMLQHPDVQYWVNCLLEVAKNPVIHNSFDACLENCMRKVLLFGVRPQDDPRLVVFTQGALEKLQYKLANPYWMNPVDYTILASFLAAMGCTDNAVTETIQERLDSAFEFASNGDYDMHTDPAGYPSIPAARRGHPLVHPRFYPENRYLYPLVYDLFTYTNLPEPLHTEENSRKIGAIIKSVLDERYQRLPWGYGLLFIPPNKYYGMGWSLHLPRFFGEEENRIATGGSVWWAEAMARYPEAVQSEWFKRMMEHLESFRTEEGCWKFPASYLTEGQNKYFVGGGHMGLGENKKNRNALKIESTAWMMRIWESLS